MNEIFFEKVREYSIVFANRFKRKEFGESQGFGVRSLKNRKIGFSYCSKEDELERAIEKAEEISACSPSSDFSFQKKSKYPKLKIVDRKANGIDANELRDMVEGLQDSMKGVENKRIQLSCSSSTARLEQEELGVDASYDKTVFSIYAEATVKRGIGFEIYSSNFLPKSDKMEEIGEKASETARKMDGAKKPKTGKHRLVFDIDAIGDLINILLPSFSGDWKRKKISNISDKLGATVFDEKLTILDDPSLTSSARPFDDEGTVSRKRSLVENGVVKGFMYDRETAALEGISGEGFCARQNFMSPPGISSCTLTIKEGDLKSVDELGSYILVKSVHGTHTANSTTGDFGVEANIAFHKKGNELLPVRGFMITGNIFEMFRNIEGLEKERHERDGLVSPRIAFNDIVIV
ncbi:MAG: TldD/PmbA family protein [Candidatus Micrarchaeota archaeon]